MGLERFLFLVLTLILHFVAVDGIGQGELPLLTLPYGTWRAAQYNAPADVYIFKNIRFAAPPIGNLRWEKPAPPPVQYGIQDGSIGSICIQSISSALNGGNGSSSGNASSSGSSGASSLFSALSGGNQSEDCLFLDVYVPGAAIRGGKSNLPVIVWVYGGGYSEGSKDGAVSLGLYDGTGPILTSGGNVIVVTFNYRLGAYGFLAGKTVEKEGVANAALHDQYAAFEWVHKYICLLGGDPNNVSAWGESAGAGSIYWLLTREGGTKDPLFHRAIIQSPAFSDKFDRNGLIEQDYLNLESLAGCGGKGLACLRALNASVINAANNKLINAPPLSPVVFNPSPDGKYFRQHATVEYAQGHYWKNLDSVIPSHVINEGQIFLNPAIQTDADFSTYLKNIWPAYAGPAGILSAIEAEYPPVNCTKSPFKTEAERLLVFTDQSSFLCSTHAITKAYAGKTYNVQFAATILGQSGTHGSDVLPTWYDPYAEFNNSGTEIPIWLLAGAASANLSRDYQSYLVSHARTGDPNTYRIPLNTPPTIIWPNVGTTSDGEYATNVLNVTDTGFELITDRESNKTVCDFWVDMFTRATDVGGYAVP